MFESFDSSDKSPVSKENESGLNFSMLDCSDWSRKCPKPGQKGDPFLDIPPIMLKDREEKDKAGDVRKDVHRPRSFDPPAGATGETRTVKPGDNFWTIAADVMTSRSGTKPSNAEIAAKVKEMAAAIGETDANKVLLRAGDKLFVPMPKVESKTDTTDSAPPEITPVDETTDNLSGVFKNEAGQVASIAYPDGTSRSFEYGPNGEVQRMIFSTSPDDVFDVWEKGEDNKWTRFVPSADGLKATGEIWQGKVSVDHSNGNFTFAQSYGFNDPKQKIDPFEVVVHPDGTKREFYGDEYVTKNASDQVTKVEHADGSATTIEYEGGAVAQIRDAGGKALLDGTEKSVSVDEAGYIHIERADGSKVRRLPYGGARIELPNGNREEINIDGSVTKYERMPDGKLIASEHVSIHNRTFAIDTAPNGDTSARYTVKDGDSLEEIAEDVLRQNMLNNLSSTPIDKQTIAMAADYIARLNGIVSPDLLVAGHELKLSAKLWTLGEVVE